LPHRNHNHSLSQAEHLSVQQHLSGSGPDRLLQDYGVNPYEYDPGLFLPIYRCWTMPYGELAMQHGRFHLSCLRSRRQQAQAVTGRLHFGLQHRRFRRYLLSF